MIRTRFRWPHLALLPVALVLCADLDDDDWGGGGGSDDHSESEGCGHRKRGDDGPPLVPPGPPDVATGAACTVTVEGYEPHDLTCTWTYRLEGVTHASYELVARDRWTVEGGEVDFEGRARVTVRGEVNTRPTPGHPYSWNRLAGDLTGAVTFYPPHPADTAHPPDIAHGRTSFALTPDDWASLVVTDPVVPHGRFFGEMAVVEGSPYSFTHVPGETIAFRVDF